MEISIYSILVWIVGVIIFSFALALFYGSDKPSTRKFVLLISITAVWTFNVGFNIGITPASANQEIFVFLLKSAYFFGTLISASFVNFFVSYPYDNKLPRPILISLVVAEIFYFFTIFFLSN